MNKNLSIQILTLVLSLLVAPLAGASSTVTKTKDTTKKSVGSHAPQISSYFPELPATIVEDTTDLSYEALKAQAKEFQDRKLAADPDINDNTMSPELRAYRDRVLNLGQSPQLKNYQGLKAKKSGRYATWTDEAMRAQALDDIMAELDDDVKFAALPSDLKVMTYGIPVARAMKSFVYRVRAWVSGTPSVNSPLLSFARQMVTGAGVYLPTIQASAVGAYLTEPMDGMRPVFDASDDFARFVGNELTGAFTRSLRRLKQVKTDRPLIVDNQLMYSSAAFQDGLQRYQSIGVAELDMMYAGLYGILAQLSAVNAYDYAAILSIAKDTGMLYGFDAGGGGIAQYFGGNKNGSAIEGAPMRDRVEILRDAEYANFMKLKGAPRSAERKRSEGWMKYSLAYTKRGAERTLAAWQVLKTRPTNELMVINPAFIAPANRWIALGEPTSLAVLNGPTAIRSAVTGETMSVNLPLLFTEPPEDLKAFLPSFAADENRSYEKTVLIDKKEKLITDLRNYREGAAHSWNYSLYGKYFQDVNGKAISKPEDVKRAARILSQTWGIGGPALAGAML